MSIRVVVMIIIFIAVLFACGHVAQLNGDVLQEKILFYETSAVDTEPPPDGVGQPDEVVGATVEPKVPQRWELSVWVVVLASFFVGFGVAFLLHALRSSQLAVTRMRDARATRKQNTVRDRVEQLYAEGLQAILADKPERAEARFRDVLAEDPQHFETLMAYGGLLRTEGRPREATDLHRRASELRAGDMRPLFALADDWQADGELDKARLELEKVIQRNPKESLRARRAARELLMNAGRWDDAKKLHDRIESAAKDDEARLREQHIGLGIRHELARGYLQKRMWRESERELRAILKVDNGHAPAMLALGQTLYASGDLKGAVAAWQNGFEVSENPIFLARLEEHFLSREDPKELIEVLRSLVANARNRALPSFFLGKVYLRLEMIDEAEAMFNAIEQKPDDALLLRYFDAKILERRGRSKEASEAYRQLIKDSLVLGLKFQCRSCGAKPEEFAARCESCGDWCTLEVQLQGVVAASQAPKQLFRPEWAAAP